MQRKTFEFEGSLFQEAITLADFDNDERNELVIGSVEGDLSIFQGEELKWRAFNLGMITCLTVGDVKNKGTNSLVVITGEGICYTFDYHGQSVGDTVLPHDRKELHYSHKQRFPLNIKQCIISDITNRGGNDLLVILDTNVRVYTWDEGCNHDRELIHNEKQDINFDAQVDAITVNTDSNGNQMLFVCIPSQGIKILKAATNNNKFMNWEPVSLALDASAPVTDAIGNIRKCDGTEGLVSFVTLDGVLKMYEGDEEKWSLPLEKPIFALGKTDIDSDREEEVVACSWDGLTFFVDHRKNFVVYKFEESVNIRAFCVGKYSLVGSKNLPTLVYVTFDGQVIVYFDVELTSLGIITLNDYDIDIGFLCKDENITPAKRAAVIRQLLDCNAE